MQTWISILLTTLLLPSGLYALSLESTQGASSRTGGINVTNVVRTTGEGSASSHVRTVIQGGTGSVKVEVSSDSDGVVKTETIEKTIEPGRSFELRIATGTANAETRAEVRIGEGTGVGMRDFFSDFFRFLAPAPISLDLSLEKATSIDTQTEEEVAPVEDAEPKAGLPAGRQGFLSKFFSNFRSLFGF